MPFFPGVEDRDVGELGPSFGGTGVGTGVDAKDADAMREKSFPLGLFTAGADVEAELELLLVRSMAEAGVPAFGALLWGVVMVEVFPLIFFILVMVLYDRSNILSLIVCTWIYYYTSYRTYLHNPNAAFNKN